MVRCSCFLFPAYVASVLIFGHYLTNVLLITSMETVADKDKVDLLFKKNFGYGRTSGSVSTAAETITSPPPLRGDVLWLQAHLIPSTPQAATDGLVEVYNGETAIELEPATTVPLLNASTGLFQAYQTVGNLKNWITPDFGAGYAPVVVMTDGVGAPSPTTNPATPLGPAGTGGSGPWVFDCQSGVLNFISNTVPAGLTSSKTLYLMAYRYKGAVGVQNLGTQGPTSTPAPTSYLYGSGGYTLASEVRTVCGWAALSSVGWSSKDDLWCSYSTVVPGVYNVVFTATLHNSNELQEEKLGVYSTLTDGMDIITPSAILYSKVPALGYQTLTSSAIFNFASSLHYVTCMVEGSHAVIEGGNMCTLTAVRIG